MIGDSTDPKDDNLDSRFTECNETLSKVVPTSEPIKNESYNFPYFSTFPTQQNYYSSSVTLGQPILSVPRPKTFTFKNGTTKRDDIKSLATGSCGSNITCNRKKSGAWLYFDISDQDESRSVCRLCGKVISRGPSHGNKRYSTSPMLTHLRNKHPEEFKRMEVYMAETQSKLEKVPPCQQQEQQLPVRFEGKASSEGQEMREERLEIMGDLSGAMNDMLADYGREECMGSDKSMIERGGLKEVGNGPVTNKFGKGLKEGEYYEEYCDGFSRPKSGASNLRGGKVTRQPSSVRKRKQKDGNKDEHYPPNHHPSENPNLSQTMETLDDLVTWDDRGFIEDIYPDFSNSVAPSGANDNNLHDLQKDGGLYCPTKTCSQKLKMGCEEKKSVKKTKPNVTHLTMEGEKRNSHGFKGKNGPSSVSISYKHTIDNKISLNSNSTNQWDTSSLKTKHIDILLAKFLCTPSINTIYTVNEPNFIGLFKALEPRYPYPEGMERFVNFVERVVKYLKVNIDMTIMEDLSNRPDQGVTMTVEIKYCSGAKNDSQKSAGSKERIISIVKVQYITKNFKEHMAVLTYKSGSDNFYQDQGDLRRALSEYCINQLARLRLQPTRCCAILFVTNQSPDSTHSYYDTPSATNGVSMISANIYDFGNVLLAEIERVTKSLIKYMNRTRGDPKFSSQPFQSYSTSVSFMADYVDSLCQAYPLKYILYWIQHLLHSTEQNFDCNNEGKVREGKEFGNLHSMIDILTKLLGSAPGENEKPKRASEIIPYYESVGYFLEGKLSKVKFDGVDEDFNELVADLMTLPNVIRDKLFGGIRANAGSEMFFLKATLLDPRYKYNTQMVKDKFKEIKKSLLYEPTIVSTNQREVEINETRIEGHRGAGDKTYCPDGSGVNLQSPQIQNSQEVSYEGSYGKVTSFENEINNYVGLGDIFEEGHKLNDLTPINWWRENGGKFPNLSRQAQTYLSFKISERVDKYKFGPTDEGEKMGNDIDMRDNLSYLLANRRFL